MELLLDWKEKHERKIRARGSEIVVETFGEIKQYVRNILMENKYIWENLGPNSQIASDDPGSNIYMLWVLRKIDTIIPNNNRMINVISSNINLLNGMQFDIFLQFKNHALAFERHQYGKLDRYPLFPEKFAEVFGCD